MADLGILGCILRLFTQVTEAVDQYKDAKFDRESLSIARRIAGEATLYKQFTSKLKHLSDAPFIFDDNSLRHTVEMRLGADTAGLVVARLGEMRQLLLTLQNSLRNTRRGTESLQIFHKATVPAARDINPLRQIAQDSSTGIKPAFATPVTAPKVLTKGLDGLCRVNGELMTLLIDPLVPLCPSLDLQVDLQDVGSFFHEDQSRPQKALQALRALYGNDPSGLGLASIRCVCSKCNPKFDHLPETGKWAFQIAVHPAMEQSSHPTSGQQASAPQTNEKQAMFGHWMPQPRLLEDTSGVVVGVPEVQRLDEANPQYRGGWDNSVRTFQRLEDSVRQRDFPLTQTQRFEVAFRMSSAALQIASAHSAHDEAEFIDWAVAVRRSRHDTLVDPFILLKPKPSGSQWGVISREPLLTKLGLRLVEVVLGRRLSDIRSEQPGLVLEEEMEGYEPAQLDVVTVRRLLSLRRLEQTVSSSFQAVVTACITHQYWDRREGKFWNLDSQGPHFLHHAAVAILMPLYSEVRRCLGHPHAKERTRYCSSAEWNPAHEHCSTKTGTLLSVPRSKRGRDDNIVGEAGFPFAYQGIRHRATGCFNRDASQPRAGAETPTLAKYGARKGAASAVNSDQDASISHSTAESDDTEADWNDPTFTESVDSAFEFLPDSENEPARLPDNHPLLKLRIDALRFVMRGFRVHMEAGAQEASQPASSQPPSLSRAGPASKKRMRRHTSTNGDPEEDEDEDGDRARGPGAARKKAKVEGPQRLFACPFLKNDERRHAGCCTFRLKRIRDVKQHLGRKHAMRPYCPRCNLVFSDEDARDDHIRDILCDQQPRGKPEGITEAQKKQLGRKSQSGQSPLEQWFTIYEILFPGQDRPTSPWLDLSRPLLLGASEYQRYIEEDGLVFLDQFLARNNVSVSQLPNGQHDVRALLSELLREGLHEIFERWANRQQQRYEDSHTITNPPTISSGSMDQDDYVTLTETASLTPSTSSRSEQMLSPPSVGPYFSNFLSHPHGNSGFPFDARQDGADLNMTDDIDAILNISTQNDMMMMMMDRMDRVGHGSETNMYPNPPWA